MRNLASFPVLIAASLLLGCSGSDPDPDDEAGEADTDTSSDSGDSDSTEGDETGVDASPLCIDFCAQQADCSGFAAPNCLEMCEKSRDNLSEAGADCQAAADAAFSCMTDAACDGWDAAALPDGSCFQAVWTDQLSVCTAPAYFPGWDACAANCHHAMIECEVDVPYVSTYTSFSDCFYECKLNRGLDVEFGCIETALPGMACELELECEVLEAFLNDSPDAAPMCDELYETHASTCGG